MATESHKSSEDTFDIPYIEIRTTGKLKPWCVDGRGQLSDTVSQVAWRKGPQMLGATIHPLIIASVSSGEPFNKTTIIRNCRLLHNAGYGIAVHSAQGESCGCGFCQKLPAIFRNVHDNGEAIGDIIRKTYSEHQDEFNTFLRSYGLAGAELIDALQNAIGKISAYERVGVYGEDLLRILQEGEGDIKAACLILRGTHEEQAAFINLKPPYTTLDTDEMVRMGHPAFNIDLWAAVAQLKLLGVSPEESIAQSLVFYVATKIALVESTGKERLPIITHC